MLGENDKSWIAHYIIPCLGNADCPHCKPGEQHLSQHTFSRLVVEPEDTDIKSGKDYLNAMNNSVVRVENGNVSRFVEHQLIRKKKIGSIFGKLEDVCIDPQLDPPSNVYYKCWHYGHLACEIALRRSFTLIAVTAGGATLTLLNARGVQRHTSSSKVSGNKIQKKNEELQQSANDCIGHNAGQGDSENDLYDNKGKASFEDYLIDEDLRSESLGPKDYMIQSFVDWLDKVKEQSIESQTIALLDYAYKCKARIL